MIHSATRIPITKFGRMAQEILRRPSLMEGDEPGEEDAPQPIADDVLHYKQHYGEFFSEFEVLSTSPDRQQSTFRIVSKAGSQRVLQVSLTPAGFQIEEDSAEELQGRVLESFEQVLSAMDGAQAFGTRLCDLVSAQLAAKLADASAEAEAADP